MAVFYTTTVHTRTDTTVSRALNESSSPFTPWPLPPPFVPYPSSTHLGTTVRKLPRIGYRKSKRRRKGTPGILFCCCRRSGSPTPAYQTTRVSRGQKLARCLTYPTLQCRKIAGKFLSNTAKTGQIFSARPFGKRFLIVCGAEQTSREREREKPILMKAGPHGPGGPSCAELVLIRADEKRNSLIEAPNPLIAI